MLPYPTVSNTSGSSHILYNIRPPPQKKKKKLQHPACLSCKLSEPSWTSASPQLQVFGPLCPEGILLGPVFGIVGHPYEVQGLQRAWRACRHPLALLQPPRESSSSLGKRAVWPVRDAPHGMGWGGDGDVLPLYHQIPEL